MKTTFRLSIIVCLAFAAGMSNAQQIAAPVVTYVPDKTGGLHPMLGIPGAAQIGAPLKAGFGIRKAAMPPAHDYLIATTSESAWPVVVRVKGDSVSAQSIQQSESPIDGVELSPTGTAAALLSRS